MSKRVSANELQYTWIAIPPAERQEFIVSLRIATLIIAERTLLREGLASLLDQTRFGVLATASSVGEIDEQHLQQALLVIVGVSAGMDKTIAALRRLRQMVPGTKLVVVADGADCCDSQELLRHGADGCILEVMSKEVLLRSLDLALLQQRLIVMGHSGGPDQPPAFARSSEFYVTETNAVRGSLKRCTLSDRERQILACLARGESNKTIARRCYIAETTVKAHLKAILRKIAVQNRTQAAIWAIDNGLVGNGSAAENSLSARPSTPPH